MFVDLTLTTKKPLDLDYAERRTRREPICEATQPEGDGETHPAPPVLGGFHGRTAGRGHAASCILPRGKDTLFAESKGLRELDGNNPLDGDGP